MAKGRHRKSTTTFDRDFFPVLPIKPVKKVVRVKGVKLTPSDTDKARQD
jgi:hypothetical protein